MTLNKIIILLKRILSSQRQIKSVDCCDMWDWLAKPSISYPACIVDWPSGSTISESEHQHLYNFELYLADLININEDAKSNEWDVLSDLSAIMEDISALLKSPEYQDLWTITINNQIQYLKEQFTDVTAALKMSFTIGVDYLNNSCQVPSDEVEFDTGVFSLSNLMLHKYDADGTEGNAFVVLNEQSESVFSEKRVLSVYRNEQYKRVIDTPPASTSEIQFVPESGGFVLCEGDALQPGEHLDILYSIR